LGGGVPRVTDSARETDRTNVVTVDINGRPVRLRPRIVPKAR